METKSLLICEQQVKAQDKVFVKNNYDDLCLVCCSKLPPQIQTDDKNLLSTNLSVIFLMRNLLHVQDLELQWNLTECGDPGNWIRLCDICYQLTRKAEEIHWKIIKFQQDLRSIQIKLVGKAKSVSLDEEHVEQLQLESDEDGKMEENSKTRRAVWRKTRAFIKTKTYDYDYSSDGIPICSPFIEGDKLANQLLNKVGSLAPVIKEEPGDDFSWKDDNEEDIDWGSGNDNEIVTEINSDSDSDWSATTTPTKSKITGSKDKLECQYCDKVFNCRGTRYSHQGAKYPTIPGQHVCHICQRACNSNGQLLMHRRGAHQIKADESPVPPKKSSKKPLPRKDVKTEKNVDLVDDNNFKGEPVKSENKIMTEMPRRKRRKYRRGDKWECRHCDKVFNHRGTCDAHEKSRHPSTPGQHICNICGAARNSNGLLLMHRRKTHGIRADGTPIPPNSTIKPNDKSKKPSDKPKKTPPPSVPKWECQHCDKVFYYRGTRNSHQLVKHPVIPGQHVCDICGKACNSNAYLLMHRLRIHKLKAGRGKKSRNKLKEPKPPSAEQKAKFQPKTCEMCEVTFTSSCGYANHMRFSHEKRYKENCNSCGMGFPSSTAFKMHLLAKHKEDPITKRLVEEGTHIWKCEVYGCPSKFIRKISLENHTKKFHSSSTKTTENGDDGSGVGGDGGNEVGDEEETSKRYTCLYCGKGFWSGAKLRRHELIHESEGRKDFKCELCGLGFMTPEYLKKHQRRIHKIFARKRSN